MVAVDLHPIEKKARRLQSGGKPRVLDLFAGCGGFSLGFKAAGYEIIGAVESDPHAARTHALNLKTNCKPTDINVDPLEFIRSITDERPEEAVDVIVGGPPCQTFARVGRAKLRAESHRQDCWTARAGLYERYIAYVKALKPLVIVLENVPDILHYQGRNVAHEICELLGDEYDATCTLLNAVNYGVPQFRERLYLIAFHKSLKVRWEWPSPTHLSQVPNGYQDIRAFARRQKRGQFVERDPLHADLAVGQRLKAAVSVQRALQDLPKIFAINEYAAGNLGRHSQKLGLEKSYTGKALTNYAEQMRQWPGLETGRTVTAHVVRCLPRDFRIFARMEPGDQYPQAHLHSLMLRDEHLAELSNAGLAVLPGSDRWKDIHKQFVPPYDPTKFPNKWRKLENDQPSRTLMAHLSHDSYSHIHYDSSQARTLSVREAARLQSFPDGFRFECCMNEAFKQVGNAVPPFVARVLARQLATALQQVSDG